MRLWISFVDDQSVLESRDALIEALDNAAIIEGDPFAEHAKKQSELAQRVAETERGKNAIIRSAEDMGERLGPGAKITFSLAGVNGTAIISRKWVRTSLDRVPPNADLQRLRAILQSLGDGELWESEG